ncbi:hypothetical protein ACHAW5_004098 [Stephanodiscus triporus]|uniref:18S rRNA (guanine(1575)-N(7))-methyltransferase Bud23 C-terminal domain-containing protein n=1 Tax=Stephanodiscus triporus TaxID=2934178 RepID=A0ABD3NQ71_9STRA
MSRPELTGHASSSTMPGRHGSTIPVVPHGRDTEGDHRARWIELLRLDDGRRSGGGGADADSSQAVPRLDVGRGADSAVRCVRVIFHPLVDYSDGAPPWLARGRPPSEREVDARARRAGGRGASTHDTLPNNRFRFSSAMSAFVVGAMSECHVLEEHGHVWVGCDVSRDMLNMANERIEQKREEASRNDDDDDDDDDDDGYDDDGYDDDSEDDDSATRDDEDDGTTRKRRGRRRPSPPTGDLLHHDMGTGLPFRPATFDACVSISALQWLCYSNSRDQIPKRRLTRFFSSLYSVLRRGARAVLQFYPESAEHAILISECAARVGFAGGVVVDYPNSTKAKKHYLVLSFERSYRAPQGLTGAEGGGSATSRNNGGGGGGRRPTGVRVADADPRRAGGGGGKRGEKAPRKRKGVGKTKEWILHKKETQRKKGKDTRKDTKYTGRKRPTRF